MTGWLNFSRLYNGILVWLEFAVRQADVREKASVLVGCRCSRGGLGSYTTKRPHAAAGHLPSGMNSLSGYMDML